MALTMEQLQTLSELAIANKRVRAAQELRDKAEEAAWLAGISDRQIAAVGRDTHTSVRRRRLNRQAIIAEHRVAA